MDTNTIPLKTINQSDLINDNVDTDYSTINQK